MIEKIELHNYRCFEYLPLSFGKDVNLLIGDNSSGKTTLIRALSSVLNSFFTGFSDENTRFTGLSENDFRVIPSGSSLVVADPDLANELPIQINFSLLGVEASLKLNSKKGRTLQKPLVPIASLGEQFYTSLFVEGQRNSPLPLFASYSTSDIHPMRTMRKLNQDKFKRYSHKPSFGYYECLRGDGFLDYWTKRLLVLQEGQKREVEIQGVRNAILTALGASGCKIIQDMQVRHNQGKVYYIMADGRETETDHLSDGLRRLVNIVLDLAFRSMLLNMGIFGAEACGNTSGTVLVDEIDLHLHPTLQSVVVNSLKKAFPNLQFIITSHAPMIMTGIELAEGNKIYQLRFQESEGYMAREVEMYGMDASTIIEDIIGIPARTKEVDENLKTLFSYIDADQYRKAKEVLQQMRDRFGEKLPELSRAEAMLNFLKEE